MWELPNFYISISKNYGECKMQFMNNGFNSCANANNLKNYEKIKLFKYKCEILSCCACSNIY